MILDSADWDATSSGVLSARRPYPEDLRFPTSAYLGVAAPRMRGSDPGDWVLVRSSWGWGRVTDSRA